MVDWKLEKRNPITFSAGVYKAVYVQGSHWRSLWEDTILGTSNSLADAVDICERIHAHESLEKAVSQYVTSIS